MDTFLLDLGTEHFGDNLHHEDLKTIKDKFIEHLTSIQKRGPTAKLWIQYWQMVLLVKDFIRAERSGNWELHLKCVERMLPYFHASGHFLYAKSAHLYLQDMRKLKDIINDDYEFTQFTEGFFTIRRTHKFWSGVWTDMTIEQVLMRSMKTQGGLTHGRANLPPTEGAAEQHCYRAYYQLQTWLGNELTVTDWGWKKHERGIMPKLTEMELIPEVLLKTICCSCETGCNNLKCGCRKHGLKCTNLCSNCHGSEKCANVEKQIYEEIINDLEEIPDHESMQTGNNVEDEDGDSLEDVEDQPEKPLESDDEEIPSKRRKHK
ncbi:hypothetical protein EVAR_40600_1 [Eumeta japonica]|uniref:Tesmin/TSO1-like CXC domain-containing protein n=1 Tax=Eumeta variegata TaxID=151549 RepID=A0A4C1XGD0_EUMVA|nr:hypothetical protein EVAR_40600_1 [Eumeta japonica]